MIQAEVWKFIPDFPNYSVSNLGRVRNDKTDRFLKTRIGPYGYPLVGVSRFGTPQTFIVHRLVAKAFVPGEEPGLQVNHIDGVKTNNHWTNLEWVTALENIRHANRLGLNHRPGRRAIGDFVIVETGEIYSNQSQCARDLGVSSSYVNDVLGSNGKRTAKGLHIIYL